MQETQHSTEFTVNQGKLVAIDEAAIFLGVKKSWIYDRTRRNAIPMRRVGKYCRFDLGEIAVWAKAECPAEWEASRGSDAR